MSETAPELFPSYKTKKTRHIYTVSEITQDIKLILENTFSEIWVEGEVSGVSRIATGTVFFSLKDKEALLKCVMFFNYVSRVKFELKNGMQIICFGKVGVYEKDGKYQLYAQAIEPKGVGSLQLALEQLKEKLEREGLFKPEHKKSIPYLPSRIGVVTSPTGAAIRDILKVLDRRFKDIHIIINPVRVQGEEAKLEIARAVNDFNRMNEKLPRNKRIEVMIVGRGGGSMEDLWAFNEEIVCRAIYDSKIPVISAVGHERDVTIADLVADLRAPTPSAAAELVIPRKEDLQDRVGNLARMLGRSFMSAATNFQETIDDLAHRLSLNMGHILELSSGEFSTLNKKLTLLNPCLLIQQYKAKTQDYAKQIYVRMSHFAQLRQLEVTKAIEKLSGLSPLNILSRGYSITFSEADNQVIKDVKHIKIGDIIKTRLRKGEIVGRVIRKKE